MKGFLINILSICSIIFVFAFRDQHVSTRSPLPTFYIYRLL